MPASTATATLSHETPATSRVAFRGGSAAKTSTALGTTFSVMNWVGPLMGLVGLSAVGGVVQGAATIGLTEQAYVKEGPRAAIKTFINGAVMTALSFIPFVGGAIAKGVGGVAKGAIAGEEAAIVAGKAGLFGKLWNVIKIPFDAIGTMFKSMKAGTAAFVESTPVLKGSVGKLMQAEEKLITKLSEKIPATSLVGRFAKFSNKSMLHTMTTQVVPSIALGIGLEAAIGKDKPAGLPSERLSPAAAEAADTKWQNYVEARVQAAKAPATAELVH